MKASPLALTKAHYKTLVDARNDRPRLLDYAQFVGLPLATAAGCGLAGVRLPVGASVGLLTVAGLLSAFLFGVMLQISDRAMDWADAAPLPGVDTSRQAIFLAEIAANAAYAALVSIAAAAIFVVASVTTDTTLRIFSAIGLGLTLHLALVLLMVMGRVYGLTEQRLIAVRTGSGTVTPLRKAKAA